MIVSDGSIRSKTTANARYVFTRTDVLPVTQPSVY